MAQNIGTLIAAPIRPVDSLDTYASALMNEAKGGHHMYATLVERDAIPEERREWGMLCTVYNDPTTQNNQTYQLAYNWYSPSITANNNWVVYTPGKTIEWLDSVYSYVTTPPTTNNGDRYLVASPATGAFLGQDGNLAIYDSTYGPSGGWVFTSPTQSSTVRVDDENNILYKFDGQNWVKEYLNQVRYLTASSIDGITYSAYSIGFTPVDSYSYSVYYLEFGATNSPGTVSVSIDTLPQIEIRRTTATATSGLTGGDLTPGIRYQLTYNSGGFLQTTLPKEATTTIGLAEDGSYEDGLYTDFVESTPIGTAVDRFNELFKYLVPASAPTLSNWSATGSFVSGRLAFAATSSPYGAVVAGATFSNTDSVYRLGIMSLGTQPLTGNTYYQDLTGILNPQVPISAQTPTPAFTANSFGFGMTGSLTLLLNGTTVSTVGLTTSAAIDTTTAGATSGFNLTAPTASKFASGYEFDMFMNRTGSWMIKKENPLIVNGYNYIQVNQTFGTVSYTLNRYEFVADSSTASVSFTTPYFNGIGTGTKQLSGISYYNFLSLNYTTQLSNHVRNTYALGATAISFFDFNQTSLGTNNVVGQTITSLPIFQPFPTGTVISPTPISPAGTQFISAQFFINFGGNFRLLNDSIALGLSVKRTVQGDFKGATAVTFGSIPTTGWFVDTLPFYSGVMMIEDFNDEYWRMVNGADKYSNSFSTWNGFTYIIWLNITGNNWQSFRSLYNGVNHTNGLQVINSQLRYPSFTFSQTGNFTSNPNFSNTATDYSLCFTVNSGHGTYSGAPATNWRTYTRFFQITSGFYHSRFKILIHHTGTNFRSATTNLGPSNTFAWLEFKLPYNTDVTDPLPTGTQSTGGVTGWLDATQPFIPGRYADGNGCLDETNSDPTWGASGSVWAISFGVQSTYFSGGVVLMRITAGPFWTGNIDRIELIPY